jgi:glucokinase
LYIGIDIGATYVKVAWAWAARGRVNTWVLSTADFRANGRWRALIALFPDPLRRACIQGRVRAVGVAVAGQVRAPGVLVESPNLPEWAGARVGVEARRAFGAPVRVENDAGMAAAGWVAADPRHRNAFVVTLGTGVGGAWVRDGCVFAQSWGGEGEIGHSPAIHGGRRCVCGRRGCTEAYAGGRAMLQRYRRSSGRVVRDLREMSVRAKSGDRAALAVYAEAGEALGTACAWVSNLIGVRHFVFTGGGARSWRWIRQPLRTAYLRQAFGWWANRTTFSTVRDAEFMGARGALAVAANRVKVGIVG